jgi:hypothetical protein
MSNEMVLSCVFRPQSFAPGDSGFDMLSYNSADHIADRIVALE